MIMRKTSRQILPIVAVVAVLLVAGGVAIASNAGFKLNFQLAAAGDGQFGNNWISLPYFNPYNTVQDACNQLGLVNFPNAGSASFQKVIDKVTGALQTVGCGGSGSTTPGFFVPGEGVRLRVGVGGAFSGNPSNIIIVGSHNPTLPLHLPQAGAATVQGILWISVPYHSTWVTFQDLCDGIGLESTFNPVPDTVFEVLPFAGSQTTRACGQGSAAANLILGKSYRVRRASGQGPIDFVPAHF